MITLGAAVSDTGKYALNGANTRNGYDLAVDAINAKGGIDIGGKRYKLAIRYYDDESTPARGTELAERLGVEMPIVAAVHRVLFERQPARWALVELMGRDLRGERD